MQGRKVRVSRTALTTGAAVLAATGVAVAGFSSGPPPAPSDNVIEACVSSNNGAVRIVKATDACAPGESRIAWNQTGPTGPKGDQGIQGIQGVQGVRGLTGPKGDKGDKGDVGARGPKGDQGIQGERGVPGLKGDKGDVGARGPQGLQGIQGDRGPTGPKGDQGDIGPTGPEGARGPRGLQGDTGPMPTFTQAFGNVEITSGRTAALVVPCPVGKQAISGGFVASEDTAAGAPRNFEVVAVDVATNDYLSATSSAPSQFRLSVRFPNAASANQPNYLSAATFCV